MKKITRRQALGTAAGALTAVGVTAAVIKVSDPSSPGADPKGAAAASSPGPIPTGTIDEVYEGRRIQIGFGGGEHQGGHHSPGLPTVRIDGNELHVMRNADGSWVSVVNHYQTFPDPVAVVRAAVRDLQGAALAPFGPAGRRVVTVRKNQAKLTADEKRAFTNALLELKRNGTYDRFAAVHNTFLMTDSDFGDRVGHRSPSFLPWHRRFLLDFEAELQKVDPKVSLPYWDWTADRTAASSLWAADFLGGTGRERDGQVVDGPFAYGAGKWAVTVGVDSRTYLRRTLGAGGTQLPTKAEVNAVLAMPVYDATPWNSASDGFRNHLEGWRGANLHNRVHMWIGGQMASAASPNDPVFWMHHAFIDLLWSEWQRRNPKSGYLPTAATPDVVDLHKPMRPWNNVTPADLLDHRKFYTFDTEH